MILECPQRTQSVMEFVLILKECQFSVSMETTEISTRSDSSGSRALKKKKGIDDTVCRCIVFYLRGEKKKRQVFGAKKCKLDFQRGYCWFVSDGGCVGGQEQKHFSPLVTKLYFHVNSSRKILLS